MHRPAEPIQSQASSTRLDLALAALDAIHRVQAVVEFDLTGKVIHANHNFLDAMGYALGEVVGQHHRIDRKSVV